MELFGELFVRMGLYTQGFSDGEDFEQKGELCAVSLAHLCREQGEIVLDHVEKGALCFEVFGGERGMGAHP